MTTVNSTAIVKASLNATWQAISNVGRVEGWHPKVERSPVLTPEPTEGNESTMSTSHKLDRRRAV